MNSVFRILNLLFRFSFELRKRGVIESGSNYRQLGKFFTLHDIEGRRTRYLCFHSLIVLHHRHNHHAMQQTPQLGEEEEEEEEEEVEVGVFFASLLMANHEAHPYAFHVSGPRNVNTLNWKDLISSSWKDAKYKRTVIACFIQAAYLLELDRQENRTLENALAPNWWIPFKYKLKQTLIDERDGSIFGAVLEWDQSAALADLILIRPSGAPKVVLALRGTLLKSPTMRRDIEDDLRFLAWESLKGSARFRVALEVLNSVCETYGSSNVCIAGHSLGAGFALQIGKVLAKEGIYVETHLFNPPSVSLAMSLRNIGDKAEFVWNRLKSMLPSSSGAQTAQANPEAIKTPVVASKSWITRLSGSSLKDNSVGKWVPYLYVNNSDYICCSYTDPDGTGLKITSKDNKGQINGEIAAKLFVVSKDKQKFLEAHGLEQWWSSDAELQQVIHSSKVISRQLRSLYIATPSQVTQAKPV